MAGEKRIVMLRKCALVVMAGALATAGAAVTTPAAAAVATVCQIQGTADFSPGLGATPGQYTYTFDGTVSGCQSNVVGAPTDGTVTATSNGIQSGGCASSIGGAGVATVAWGGSPTDISRVSYSTQAVGTGVVLSGTVTSGRYVGSSVGAVLAFATSSPQSCAIGGLTSAAFTGSAGIGRN